MALFAERLIPPAAVRRAMKSQYRLVYWIGGLPVASRYKSVCGSSHLDELRREFARSYWGLKQGPKPLLRLLARLLWMPRLIMGMLRYTARNGRLIRARTGTTITEQLLSQMLVYKRHGILPRWYYIFSLYEEGGVDRAAFFLNRFETKPVLFKRLNRGGTSPLGDKAAFAQHCVKFEIPHVPVLAVADGNNALQLADLPQADLFIKPIRQRGGRGAERWQWVKESRFRGPDGTILDSQSLIAELARKSRHTPSLVQPRVVNHPSIADLSNGALSTVRVLSCLNELGVPEIVAASFRMAIGGNVTVDNIHAGGIAAAVDIEDGTLGLASNLGDDAALGWLDFHPNTGGKILGRKLPLWPDVLKLARWAHCAFADRVVIGWDIAILVEGPTLVEGNSGPDVDLMQRPLRRGIGQGRFAELLLYNLRGGQAAPAQANSNRFPLRSPPGAGSDIGHR